MFLFTTPKQPDTSRSSAVGSPVVQAIRNGADKTGTGFDYLLKTAQRESALDPQAKASTSSATGLFQFIEQTWLGMVKEQGPRHGLAAYADAIKDNDGGRLSVSDPKTRQDILDLRRDPQLASVMAGALTNKNRDALSTTLGRQPTQGELYIAHVMGARGASDLIRGVESTPQGAASAVFPEAAAANRPIFFDKTGKPRALTEVYAMLSASHVGGVAGSGAATTSDAVPAGQASPAVQAWPGVARAKGTMALFSTEGSRAPVSEAVTKYWATPRNNGPRIATIENGPRFFPRENNNADTSMANASGASPALGGSAMSNGLTAVSNLNITSPVLMGAPLPPVRPASMNAVNLPMVENAKPRAPLDLSRFLKGQGRS